LFDTLHAGDDQNIFEEFSAQAGLEHLDACWFVSSREVPEGKTLNLSNAQDLRVYQNINTQILFCTGEFQQDDFDMAQWQQRAELVVLWREGKAVNKLFLAAVRAGLNVCFWDGKKISWVPSMVRGPRRIRWHGSHKLE
jgi:hypothetical protein